MPENWFSNIFSHHYPNLLKIPKFLPEKKNVRKRKKKNPKLLPEKKENPCHRNNIGKNLGIFGRGRRIFFSRWYRRNYRFGLPILYWKAKNPKLRMKVVHCWVSISKAIGSWAKCHYFFLSLSWYTRR